MVSPADSDLVHDVPLPVRIPVGRPGAACTTVPSPGLYMDVQVSPSVRSFSIMP